MNSKGFLVDVYRHHDCTNGGSRDNDSILVINEPEPFILEVPEIFESDGSDIFGQEYRRPPYYLVHRPHIGDYILYPADVNLGLVAKGHHPGYMFGGNFAYTSDSRWKWGAVKIFDRNESRPFPQHENAERAKVDAAIDRARQAVIGHATLLVAQYDAEGEISPTTWAKLHTSIGDMMRAHTGQITATFQDPEKAAEIAKFEQLLADNELLRLALFCQIHDHLFHPHNNTPQEMARLESAKRILAHGRQAQALKDAGLLPK